MRLSLVFCDLWHTELGDMPTKCSCQSVFTSSPGEIAGVEQETMGDKTA